MLANRLPARPALIVMTGLSPPWGRQIIQGPEAVPSSVWQERYQDLPRRLYAESRLLFWRADVLCLLYLGTRSLGHAATWIAHDRPRFWWLRKMTAHRCIAALCYGANTSL